MRRLYTSSRDRKIFGVCGGLAEYLNIDATLLRILLIVVAVFSAGSVIVVYILAGFIIPREPQYGGGPSFGAGPFGGAPGTGGKWGGGYNGWTPPPHSGGTSSGWTPGPTPWPGPGPSAQAPKPQPQPTPTSSAAAPELDAMMDDIEKKALKRELEELKARIAKFEQQSKGE
ncbi:PspC domain-containing protein [Cohnella zeiphila]|uniref:PspC domain-containing protein n=1 Tax=Cohnella zeiphila TaxID=2761120 RepID=A0A7X0SRP5_9BACL|nr:PspC domain-containing protein [Cohnella zeiphila]MBB6734866.1 PspC domain-containing protein [Cohnella zeiphila]